MEFSNRKRYVVECTWSGYRSSQAHVCHRTVIRGYEAKRLSKIHAITFTDGTNMSVDVREAKPREKVEQKHGYDSLLNSAMWSDKEGCVSVMELN